MTESPLKNQLKAVRTRLGLSQAELAQAAGVTRQTIGGIEGSLYAPSAAVALRLSRTLGCRVEELFWLEDGEAPVIQAVPARTGSSEKAGPVLLGQVGERWVAHSLSGNSAFRLEMVPADGSLEESSGGVARVRLLDSTEALARTVLIAGCAPAISLWTRSAERWHPGLRAAWIYANSTRALEALRRGEVHIAGIHMVDAESGEENEPQARRLAAEMGQSLALVNFGVWEEGLALAAGNPKGISGVRDLAGAGIQFMNREAGAGGRVLIENELEKAGMEFSAVAGFGNEVGSHHEIVQAVASGEADAGVVPAALAYSYGLEFVGLRRVRFDLVLRTEHLEHEPVRQLLTTLEHRSVRRQLQVLGGLETERSGEVLGRV